MTPADRASAYRQALADLLDALEGPWSVFPGSSPRSYYTIDHIPVVRARIWLERVDREAADDPA